MPPKSLAQVSKEYSTALLLGSSTKGQARRPRRELSEAFNFDDVHPPPTPQPAPLARADSIFGSLVLPESAVPRTFSPPPPSLGVTQSFYDRISRGTWDSVDVPKISLPPPTPYLGRNIGIFCDTDGTVLLPRPSGSNTLSGALKSKPDTVIQLTVDPRVFFRRSPKPRGRRTSKGVTTARKVTERKKSKPKPKSTNDSGQGSSLLQQAVDAGIVTATEQPARQLTAAEIAEEVSKEYLKDTKGDRKDN
ncbi:hypothetical protein NMY22_g13728 [Coprinellus aureogranulatus]|nr:hypothetical protein NMY22_g13728 [Coprinellus aureogranulatus]